MSPLPRDADGKLSAYAWPGGYPIIYLTGSCSVLCAECAINDDNDSDPVTSASIHYEGPDECCAECNKMIASAYGDPDEEEK